MGLFEGPLRGLVTAECEVDDDALAALVPPFPVVAEVPEPPFFSGARLARATAAELTEVLRSLMP